MEPDVSDTNEEVSTDVTVETTVKKSKGAAIAAVIFAILFAGAAGFILYDKLLANNSDEETKCNVGEETTKTLELSDVDFEPYHYNPNDRAPEGTVPFYNAQGASNGWITVYQDTNFKTLDDVKELDNKHFEVSITKAKEYYNASIDTLSATVDFDIPVRMVYVDGMGQAVGYEVILFVLSDGTVYYIPASKSVNSGKMILKELEGVDNVVTVTSGSSGAYFEYDGELGGTGGHQIYLHRLDGGYYDLYSLVEGNL